MTAPYQSCSTYGKGLPAARPVSTYSSLRAALPLLKMCMSSAPQICCRCVRIAHRCACGCICCPPGPSLPHCPGGCTAGAACWAAGGMHGCPGQAHAAAACQSPGGSSSDSTKMQEEGKVRLGKQHMAGAWLQWCRANKCANRTAGLT